MRNVSCKRFEPCRRSKWGLRRFPRPYIWVLWLLVDTEADLWIQTYHRHANVGIIPAKNARILFVGPKRRASVGWSIDRHRFFVEDARHAEENRARRHRSRFLLNNWERNHGYA